jgi:hypothetical protein
MELLDMVKLVLYSGPAGAADFAPRLAGLIGAGLAWLAAFVGMVFHALIIQLSVSTRLFESVFEKDRDS